MAAVSDQLGLDWGIPPSDTNIRGLVDDVSHVPCISCKDLSSNNSHLVGFFAVSAMVGSNNRSDGPRCVTGGGDPGGRLLHSLLPSLWPLRGKVDDLSQEEPECEVLGTHRCLPGYNLHDFVSL